MLGYAIGKLFQLVLFVNCLDSVINECVHFPVNEKKIRHGVPIANKYGDSRVKRATYQNIRIFLHFDSTVDGLGNTASSRIKDDLMPAAVGYFEKLLQVKRANGPILLNRECPGDEEIILKRDATTTYCNGHCNTVSRCGEVVIPKEHLMQCRACRAVDRETVSCGRYGDSDARGVDTDFILYVSAKNSAACQLGKGSGSRVVAYSYHCQTEKELDRPVAGHMNICPEVAKDPNRDREFMLSTIKHELLHSMAMSINLLAFYRDEFGRPRTSRNDVNLPRFLLPNGVFKWDSNTVKKVKRSDWWVSSGTVTREFDMMVTPNVLREARNHFNCQSLEGAELEDQGLGLALSHWEKRLYENEAMTGSHTHNAVFSRLTLAMLEDTGWYKVNYDLAEPLVYGRNLGCDFVKKSCGWWIQDKSDKGESTEPYCIDKGYTMGCTVARNAVGLCNVGKYPPNDIPKQYQNYRTLPGVRSYEAKNYGGSLELADFCGIYTEFDWKEKIVDTRSRRTYSLQRRSTCTTELSELGRQASDSLEVFGKSSVCVNHEAAWERKKCSNVSEIEHLTAGCYEHFCQASKLWLVFKTGKRHVCLFDGQVIQIKEIHDGWLYEGSIICPPCSTVCKDCKTEKPATIPDARLAPEIQIPCDKN